MTLVEVLIVVAIMALISGVGGIYVMGQYRKAQIRTAKTNTRSIRSAAMVWLGLEQRGGCPTVEQLIQEGAMDPAAEQKDPWGQSYRIECDAGITVRSAGIDRRMDTEDDIHTGATALEEG